MQGVLSYLKQARGLFFKPYVMKKNVEGVNFDFYVGDPVGRDWYDTYCTDPDWPELKFLKDHMINPGDVIFECGAHHGCTAVILSHWVKEDGHVYTFEPSPKNCRIVRENIKINNLENVTLIEAAVGETEGVVNISSESNSSITSVDSKGAIKVLPLDQFLDRKPTFLKIDVEGFELQVLRGAKQILATKPKIAIEIHTEVLGNYGASVESILAELPLESYKCYIQTDDAEYPVKWDRSVPITKRVHLFCIPR